MARNATLASTSTASLDDKRSGSPDNKDALAVGGELPSTTSSTFDGEHVFEDPKLGKYFVPIAEYEGMHRWV